ncbi:TolC family protein [Alienimonas chondri]|uniref:TolC family protein n=1 Tax=Alienimonas chondri TaxID=2681879 RepID=A0ABX1VFV6_9PLAN|nr:TolC family protein [Alienimonas chondri]NNJ26984.1 hypothetical protein [Alienimonas chondri]
MPHPHRRSARSVAALAAGPLLFAPAAFGQEGEIPVLAVDGPVFMIAEAPAADTAAAMTVPPADAAAPLRTGQTVPITLQNLLARAVNHSAQIRVFAELPEIRRTSITEADAAFDWHTFAEGRWDDVTDPVGNTLTTGGAERFEDHHLAGSAGLRRRNRLGGRVEAAQRLGWQDTNSTFFQPDQQGTTRLSLSYTHPLMRGQGLAYNTALTVLATIDTDVATDEFHRQLQSHLLEVTRAYWGLSLERSVLVQKRASLARAEEIARRLNLRREIDAVASQIARAEAAVAARRAELVRSEAAVRNAEGRIRALVNDPALGSGFGNDLELIPTDVPSELLIPVSVPAAVEVAIQKRPEISQAMRQIRAAAVRCDMSESELLPVLNLVTEAYVSGLRGEGDVAQSFGDQFTAGRPSYSIGLQFEVPLGNRAAQARNARRRMELRQLRNQYRTTLETLSLEVEVAARELDTAGREMDAKRAAKSAAEVQLDYVTQRWIHLPGEGGTASLVLESLLDAQDRLAEAEVGLLTSRITYNLAMTELKRATGELLTSEQVIIGRGAVDGLPTAVLEKPELIGASYAHGPAFESLSDERRFGPGDAPPPPAPPAYDDPGFVPPSAPADPRAGGGVLAPMRLDPFADPTPPPRTPREATGRGEPSVRRTSHSSGSAAKPAAKCSLFGRLFGGERR